MKTIKLYSSREHPGRWVAYVSEVGWLSFPNRENGWTERTPVRGLDPIHLREVPIQMAVHAGLQPSQSRPEFKKVA